MTKTIGLHISGLVSEKEAESELEEVKDWFRNNFNQDMYVVTTSISKGPFGWKMELNAVEET